MALPKVFTEEFTVDGKHVEIHYWQKNGTYWYKSWIDGEEYRALRISKLKYEQIYENRVTD